MKIEYIKQGDYYLPNLALAKKINKPINKYGLSKLDYLKQHKLGLYFDLLMNYRLNDYLFSVSNNALNQFNTIMNEYIKNDSRLSEKNKSNNQMEWIQLMNNYKNATEEIVIKEYIYGDIL